MARTREAEPVSLLRAIALECIAACGGCEAMARSVGISRNTLTAVLEGRVPIRPLTEAKIRSFANRNRLWPLSLEADGVAREECPLPPRREVLK